MCVVGGNTLKKLYLMIVLMFLALVGCSNASEQEATDSVNQEMEV
jgi:PBP1b-binding outer membrane lipoprotein LpoB